MQVSGCVSGTLLSCLCVFVKINLPWCLHHGPLKKKKKKQKKKKKKQADVCKTFTSRPFRIPGTPAPNYKNWDKRRTVNSKVLLGLGWATGGRSMFYKHLFLYLLNMLNLKNVIL